MTDATPRLALPLLVPGQAQKEMFHNEALARLDLLVQASVVAVGLDSPPAAPAPGDAWVVGADPTGAWAGQAGALAGWTAGGWRFAAPAEGMTVWDRAAGRLARWQDGAWGGGRSAAIPDPAGGGAPDAPARAAVVAILAVLRAHGLIAP